MHQATDVVLTGQACHCMMPHEALQRYDRLDHGFRRLDGVESRLRPYESEFVSSRSRVVEARSKLALFGPPFRLATSP